MFLSFCMALNSYKRSIVLWGNVEFMKIIGIDIGTTTISGVVLEKTGTEKLRMIEAKTIENGSFLATENDWERVQDAENLVKKSREMLDYFLDRYPDVERIGLTGQMHGIVYIDQEGNGVSPLYTWQDVRGNLCDEKKESLVDEIQRICHIPASSGYGMVTHIYNLRHHLIPDAAVSFCTIMDYLGIQLTGRKKASVHASNAASFGFWNGPKGIFLKEELRKMGVEDKWLPNVCTGIETLGQYRNCIVTTAIGDNQASFLGSVGKEKNTLLINVGTGGQISVLSDQYFAAEGIEARPFLDGTFLLVGSSLCGGKAYALLENFFRSIVRSATGQNKQLYRMMEQLARAGKESIVSRDEKQKLQIETIFNGTRANPEQRGSIVNLSADNFTPEAFSYGILEGMSRELYVMYQTIHTGTAMKIERMIGAGNGLRKNPVLCEIIEEMFRTKLKLAEHEEEAAAGAAVSSLCCKIQR